MFLGVLVKESSHFHLRFEKCFGNKPKTNLYFDLKPPKVDNIPSIRYKMIWPHHVPNVKQHIRLYYLQILIYKKNSEKLLFFADGSKISMASNFFQTF